MDFRFSEKEESFRREIVEFAEREIPLRWREISKPECVSELDDEAWAMVREFQRKLAQKGWLAPAYSKGYGGAELSITEQLILAEEMCVRRAPSTGLETQIAVDIVGPTILHFGNEEQKKKYCTEIAHADITFCLLYTEPDAGSDLGNVQSRAIEDGDDYVVSGQKVYVTAAHRADYGLLLARTDPSASKHRGISMLIVNMKSPGIAVRPLINIVGKHHFNEVILDNVKVPKKNLVGEKNRGFYQLMIALSYERGMFWLPPQLQHELNLFIRWAKETEFNGKRLLDDAQVQLVVADIAIQIEISRLLSYRVVTMINQGQVPIAESAMLFLMGSEIERHMTNTMLNVLGLYGQLYMDSKWAPLGGRISAAYLGSIANGVGGGTLEIRRNTIAQARFGLQRAY